MDQATYTYTALAEKYQQFAAPSFEVTLGGSVVENISELEVEITADGTAGGCTFLVEGLYDHTQSSWPESLLRQVALGARLTVSAGYVKRREIFYGCVDEYSLEFDEDGAPRVKVSGIDGLGYLMSQREPLYAGQRQAADVVRAILNKSVSAGFAKSVTVGTLKGFVTPIVKEQVDDWRFLNLLAQRYGASLLVVDGEMIFDTAMDHTAAILTLTAGLGLRRFQKRVSLANQVGQVEILGRDVNQKPVKGAASSVSVGGSGKSAAQLVPAYQKAVLREYSEFVRTQEECRALAQARLNSIAMGLVTGEGQCVGLPELIPGRYLTIDGSDDQVNGTYFLTKVRHLFSNEGFETVFEFKGAKV